MGGYEVVCEEDVLAASLGAAVEHPLEFQQSIGTRFAHQPQHIPAHMLRSYLHLSGYMVLHQGLQIVIPFDVIGEDHIVPYPGADEDLLDAGYGPDPVQQSDLAAMVYVQLRAWTVTKTSLVPARTDPVLLETIYAVHVGRWSSDIAYDAVEIGLGGHLRGLTDD